MQNVTAQDVVNRYSELKAGGFEELHSQIFKSRLTCIGQILPPGVVAALNKDDLPAIAYNFPKMYLRDASGAQRATRIDERVFPLQDGSKEVAGGLTRWLKWHSTRNHLHDAYSAAFMDQWMGGFAVMENSRVILDDPLGENQCVAGNPLQHMFDLGGMRPDGRDMTDQMKETWLSAKRMAHIFGIPLAQAEGIIRNEARTFRSKSTGQLSLFDVNSGRHNDPQSTAHSDLIRGVVGHEAGRVLEWFFVNYEERVFLYDMLTAMPIDVSDRTESDVAQLRMALEQEGHPTLIVGAPVRRIYRVCSTDTTILKGPELYGPQTFPFVYALGYRIGNHIVGEAKDLVGPALGASRALSSLTGVISKSGNTSIISSSDADIDEEDLSRLDQLARGWSGHVNIPGMRQMPQVIQHGQFNPELFNYFNQAEGIMKAMAGSPDQSRGISGGSHQSGIAAAQLIQQGQQSGQVLRDNFLLMRKLNAETNIRLLQYYEGPIPFRTLRVLRDDDTPEEIQFNTLVGDQIFNDLSVGTYSVTVEQTPYTVTDRHFKMQQTLDAFKAAGIPIPPDLVFEMQDDPDAEKHGRMVREYQQEQLEMQLAAALQK